MNLGSFRNTHDFMNPTVSLPTSTFNRPSQLKTAFDAGQLIPVFTEEVLPGDTHQLKTASFGRFATLIRPILDNVYLDIHYFFVPNRIIWDGWEKFQAGAIPGETIYPFPDMWKTNPSPEDAYEFVPTIKPTSKGVPGGPGSRGKTKTPRVVTDGFQSETLADYFGMPTHTGSNNIEVNCLYHRAYNKIYYDWYMDETFNGLDTSSVNAEWRSDYQFELRTDSTNVTDEFYPIQRRCKRRDYFTSCLPWSQKGQPVSIPLGGQLPLRGLYSSIGPSDLKFGNPTTQQYELVGLPFDDNSKLNAPVSNRTNYGVAANLYDSTPFSLEYDDTTKKFKPPYVDLGSSHAITVNQLREAVAIQRLLEKDARGGSRYIEVIKNHFGVTSPDYRLQRSEFLGSTTQLLDTTAVPQTSSTDSSSPQAHLASYGTTSNSSQVFKKTFTEHGVILGIASARVDQTYQQGLERRFSRSDRYDYYLPSLAHLGEQPVLNKEIYYSDNDINDNAPFGYIPRWDEYRFKQSHVTGAMRSNYVIYEDGKNVPASLDSWHLANNFILSPRLNSYFMQEYAPIERVVAVPTERHFVFDFYFDLVSTRVMPITSIPSLVQRL